MAMTDFEAYTRLVPSTTQHSGPPSNSSVAKADRLHGQSVGSAIAYILTSLSPLLFFSVGVVAARLDGQELSRWGENVSKALILIPTLYPVLFAALMAHALRCFALRMVERGTTIGRLEQLLGSTTFGGTLLTHSMLRLFNISALLLVALWSLSPLGGQASLRMVTVQPHIKEAIDASLWYRSSSESPIFDSGSGRVMTLPKVNALFMSTILVPESTRNASQDIYRNVKIPMIEELSFAGLGPGGWLTVDNTSGVEYAGFLGIPVAGIPSDATVNFTLDTSYLRLDCAELEKRSWGLPANETLNQETGGFANNTFMLYTADADANRSVSTTIRNDTAAAARSLVFISRNSNNASVIEAGVTFARCRLTMSHVASRVLCNDGSCRVTSMRRSELPQAPANITLFDGTGPAITFSFFSQFTNAAGPRVRGADCTLTERFLYDPGSAFNIGRSDCVDLFSVAPAVFSRRLTQLLNTYLGASQAPASVAGISQDLDTLQPPPDISALSGDNSTLPLGAVSHAQNLDAPFLARRTAAKVTRTDQRYVLQWHWFAIFMVSTLVLLVVSLAGTIIQFSTIVPDVFGYASSFTRDNPFVDIPPDADVSALDGLDRAKMLRDLRVKMADVRPAEEVGHIAFVTSTRGSGRDPARVRLGRSYC
ncbi:hypothetical protein FN846DRAFT_978353 [Sphaerosporella brunnea]|uniref:Uncharacterized protein n=1 Tax=Sphaerosporella brunnea TaxID=1250544 RepID=A0A5J5EDA9_9PEZI|nr:hypothetical protein FN846DRAFT_978353 [Sphaerosporella brunnea]